MHISRRTFIGTMAMTAAATAVKAQLPADTANLWGSHVIDCHFHLRRQVESNIAHMDGCGVAAAFLLTRLSPTTDVGALQARYPGRFPGWAASTDVTQPDAEKLLTAAVKSGATALGEIKYHVASDGPEMRRMYALAAELNVPILIHFQEVPHTPTEGLFNTGFKRFDAILKAYPKTRFVGHADAFWANVSANYANDKDYPSGPIVRGGITDRWLSDYPNLFGDLSANSGNNALTRDPSFTKDFLKRHPEKLIFGSDCSCTDGRGGGISQGGNPGASRLAGKCVARETLTVLKRSTTPELFRKLTWENGHSVYGIKA
ncbi:MAG: amidohydrolase family protein [Edaphobacter sp.]